MENDILTTLRSLKQITPDSAYTKHSRMLLLASPQVPATEQRVSTFFRLSAILGAGVIGIVILLGGTTYINETYSPLALEGLNQRSLTAEADEINSSIEITLETIDYLDTSNQMTLTKIAEIQNIAPVAAPAASLRLMSAPAEVATTTPETASVDTFLIDSDSAEVPAERQINDILEQIAQ
ncbi:MAG: hypothetical protein ACD_81C00096G0003 [uncultured bacterium]|uniref:Uncharacterized protein n=2 Tax=Candidatus Wolfeibacteriota TaxID=1752735 RepID=A0A0G1H6H6_9BACT|nr:MAG: hypothetical protein ACD_81C00096G0003 [uncultured bacterium]KKR12167.1 MAG: hypothetical protein UT41_C0003G0094 [Candidatus Wolfebacteria bacterium GW2011_GWC2_39_22]KKT42996.1 MAG: hypothetical protein UW32_C0003G0099 [Candidatus Wolfebacteria bacterium GW2011_GWE2_44_13]HBI25213.1 hypothetical protein [Candidatus Wolfebacteria bacterium]